jgi:hypothetical protein
MPEAQVSGEDDQGEESKPPAEQIPQQQSKPSVDAFQEEVVEIRVPGTDIELPMPAPEIMTAAATTSVISVGATLGATSLFKKLVKVMKPALKNLVRKLTPHKALQEETWGRRRLKERYLRKQQQRENLL